MEHERKAVLSVPVFGTGWMTTQPPVDNKGREYACSPSSRLQSWFALPSFRFESSTGPGLLPGSHSATEQLFSFSASRSSSPLAGAECPSRLAGGRTGCHPVPLTITLQSAAGPL